MVPLKETERGGEGEESSMNDIRRAKRATMQTGLKCDKMVHIRSFIKDHF